jgi:hypothetical protein
LIVTALAGGLVFGLAAGLVFGLADGLAVGLGAGLMGPSAPVLLAGLADPDSNSSPSPVASWDSDRNYALVVGLAAGLVFGLGLGFVFGIVDKPVAGLVNGLVAGTVGLVVGLGGVVLSSQVCSSSLAAVQLAVRWQTPVHLPRFLDDARERNVLRTLGPAYQFRHARLQDRLAAATPEMTTMRAAHRLTSAIRVRRSWP